MDSTCGRSAISWAAGNGFDEVGKLLIKGIGGHLGGFRRLFRKGAQVDSVDKYGRTPLVYAVWNMLDGGGMERDQMKRCSGS